MYTIGVFGHGAQDSKSPGGEDEGQDRNDPRPPDGPLCEKRFARRRQDRRVRPRRPVVSSDPGHRGRLNDRAGGETARPGPIHFNTNVH